MSGEARESGDEGVDVVFGRVEGAHPADFVLRRVPIVEAEALAEGIGDAVGQRLGVDVRLPDSLCIISIST